MLVVFCPVHVNDGDGKCLGDLDGNFRKDSVNVR